MRLDLYFARRYIRALLMVLGIFAGLIAMVESLDQIGKFSDVQAGGTTILIMALLRVPRTLYEILPIIVMIATLVLFLGLARSSELVVARASGRGAMRSLVPIAIVAFAFGVLTVAVLNPFRAATEHAYETRENLLLKGERQVFSVSDEGLWLREGDANGQMVIRASRSNLDGSLLQDVSFIGYSHDSLPMFRIEAKDARIEDGQWVLTEAKRWPLTGAANPEAAATFHDRLTLPTSLSLDEIRDRFGSAKAVSIWEMSSFIDKLEIAGFSARSYRMWLQSELALPFAFVAMMLIAAGFTMRHTRLGRTSTLVVTAIILAFGFYFLRSFAIVMGQNGLLPIALAAWAPPLAAILATLALLLHLEDG
ncbi:MAG: LPS export ABC transporter permease LptG [Rhodobacteraceae bacterium]|uniref:LPS export ABC transporter permease LptG n=1 Tax=Celeribacter sp. HF31 TaxID=2721558 RepID=UPI00143215FC|nr:LPS export ABC transporter permease LptG [Celeribacter sp. HF31]NIY78658.1 LPS export ABC transporter permease LptG [Celeribacter sp. HF31]NVK47684.1 LPS export ABC transporter permease LptG [Paracoccaceae bacterium]